MPPKLITVKNVRYVHLGHDRLGELVRLADEEHIGGQVAHW